MAVGFVRSALEKFKRAAIGQEPIDVISGIPQAQRTPRVSRAIAQTRPLIQEAQRLSRQATFPAQFARVQTAVPRFLFQGAARAGGTLAATAARRPEIRIDPRATQFEQRVQRTIFGEEPLESIPTQIERFPGRARELGITERISRPLAVPLVVGAVGAEFIPGGKAIKKIPKVIKSVKEAKKLIAKVRIPQIRAPQPSKLLTTTGKPKLNTPRSRQVSLGHDTALKSDRLHTTGATTPPPKTVIGPPQPPRSIKLPSEGSVPSKFIKSSIDKVHNLYTQVIDRFHPLTKLAKQAGEATGFKQKVGQKATMRNALTAHYGTGSTATHHVDFELAPILKRHNVNDFREAAIAFRDLELAGRGIKGSRSQKQADQILKNLESKLGKEEFNGLKGSLEELYQYQNNLVKTYLLDTGVLTDVQFAGMQAKNQFYIPFKRVMDTVDEFLGIPSKQVGSVSSQNVIKGIKGSERELVDPIESILANTYKIVGLGNRQKVARALVNLGDSLPEGTIRRLGDAEVIGRKNTISLFENGKTIRFEVPREIEEAAKSLNDEQLAAIVKIMSVPTQVFRASATGLNPEFAIPNVSRDLQSAVVNAGVNPLRWVKGLASLAKKDELFEEFLKAGGKTSRISIDQPVLKKTVREITSRGISVNRPSDLLRIAQTAGEFSEIPTRIASFETVFNRSLKQGFTREEALARGGYAAQEATVNFARRGSMTKNVNAIIAFLNARVQGVDRLIRSIKENPVGAGTRLGIVAITPALVTRAWNEQFPAYNDERIVSERTKRFNYIIMLSNDPIDTLGGAQYIKIPKGEIGSFSNIIDEFIDFATAKGGDVAQAMKETLLALSPIDKFSDVIPTVLKPPIEVGINKSFFTGFDIVPEWKQSFPKGFQDSTFTSPLFRAIGQKINVSPAKLQHLAEGYGTGLVRIAEQVAQPFVPEKFITEKNKRGAAIQRIPVARRLFGGARRSELQQAESKKRIQDFLKKEIGTVRNAVKRGEIDTEQGFDKIKELQTEMGETIVPGGIIELKAGPTVQPVTGKLFESVKKEKETFKQVKDLLDLDLSDELLDQELKVLGVSIENARYFDVARLSVDERGAFTIDLINSVGDVPRDQLMEQLVELRRKVAGKQVLSNSVINDLFDDDLITKEEKKFLKSVEFDKKTGELKIKPTALKAKKKKKLPKITVSRRRITPVRRRITRAARVRVPAITVPRTETRAKLIAKTQTVESFRRLLTAKR